MNITSIYEEHYRGETYRFAVAYLRARSPTDDRAPRGLPPYRLDTQRQIIAKAARASKTIIVAEFIEYGRFAGGLRPALNGLLTVAEETRVPECLAASDAFLARDRDDWRYWMEHFHLSDVSFVPAYDRLRQ